jgi:hypothetical protein
MLTSPSPLPPLYDRWMRECLTGPIPNEPRATCDDCAMCAPPGQVPGPRDPVFYDPGTKCCTYMPVMWNFLTGAVLDDNSAEAAAGRRSVEARIDAGVAITPLGMERSPVYKLLYGHIPEAFGRARTMRCPHYIEEGGLCGVWRSRESTCATWFCKHERGAVGKRFWQQLHRLLGLAERQVASWCILQLELGPEALGSLFPFPYPPETPVTGADFDGRPDPAQLKKLWGKWFGREREFYRVAGRLVQGLSWKEVQRIGSPELHAAEQIARHAFASLSDTSVPARLRGGSFQQNPSPAEGAVVTTYSPLDPLQLSPEVMSILPFFNGQSTAAACQAIAAELGLEVEPDLLRKLTDFGVLEDATGGS